METKETPPPYDSGYSNPTHGQPSPYPAQPPFNTQPVSTTSTTVVVSGGGVVGGCPVCHNMEFTGTYSCCAWFWGICCFPCGLICCLCMRKKKCTKCGFKLG